eukprot:7933636-Heterocapsa_arctica.AAC.1
MSENTTDVLSARRTTRNTQPSRSVAALDKADGWRWLQVFEDVDVDSATAIGKIVHEDDGLNKEVSPTVMLTFYHLSLSDVERATIWSASKPQDLVVDLDPTPYRLRRHG